jgi:hypothetical protein
MRHLIFFAKSNGFDAVIRRVGRRVLIDEAAFFHWVAGGSRDVKSSAQTPKNHREMRK